MKPRRGREGGRKEGRKEGRRRGEGEGREGEREETEAAVLLGVVVGNQRETGAPSSSVGIYPHRRRRRRRRLEYRW